MPSLRTCSIKNARGCLEPILGSSPFVGYEHCTLVLFWNDIHVRVRPSSLVRRHGSNCCKIVDKACSAVTAKSILALYYVSLLRYGGLKSG